MKRVFLILFSSLFILLLFEFTLRFYPSKRLLYKYIDKQVHCLDKKGIKILFCPNVNKRIVHYRDFSYQLTTDSLGKRITPKIDSQNSYWVIGDSLSMGYGVDDNESFPYLLGKKLNARVENFAVDSMGSLAIKEYFEESLSLYKKPKAVFWIFSVSDFIDDLKFIRLKRNFSYRILFKLQFYLRKNFYSFNYLKLILEDLNFSKERNSYLKSKINISSFNLTYKAILDIQKISKNSKIPLYIMMAPDMNINGKPDFNSEIQQNVKQFFFKNSITFIDLSKEFREPNHYYIKNDGHYSSYTNHLFTDYAYEILKASNIF